MHESKTFFSVDLNLKTMVLVCNKQQSWIWFEFTMAEHAHAVLFRVPLMPLVIKIKIKFQDLHWHFPWCGVMFSLICVLLLCCAMTVRTFWKGECLLARFFGGTSCSKLSLQFKNDQCELSLASKQNMLLSQKDSSTFDLFSNPMACWGKIVVSMMWGAKTRETQAA